jgi:hypothetical protein
MPTRRRPRAFVPVLLACAAAVVLGGCAVNPSETQGESLTPTQFSARSNAACVDAELSTLGGAAPYTARQYQDIQAHLVVARRAIDALVAPVDWQQDVHDLLGGYTAVANAAGSAAQALGTGQTPEQAQAAYVAAVATPLPAIGTAAQDIDAPACGNLPVAGQ